jgi:hypothetical protein
MTYGQLKSYDDFKKAFTELLWDSSRQSEIKYRVYQDQFNCRSMESLSEHYVRYAKMASILPPYWTYLVHDNPLWAEDPKLSDKCQPKINSRGTCFPHYITIPGKFEGATQVSTVRFRTPRPKFQNTARPAF